MRSSSRFRFTLACLIRLCIPVLLAHSLVQPSHAQDISNYLFQTGAPSFAAMDSFPGGVSVNMTNGNLHMEIPLGSYPQRGSAPVVLKLVYDSRVWVQAPEWTSIQSNFDPYVQELPALGWHIVGMPRPPGLLPSNGSPNITCAGVPLTLYTNQRVWTGPDGATHIFNFNRTPQCISGGAELDAHADDGSGLHMFQFAAAGSTFNFTTIYAKDGTLLYSDPIDAYLPCNNGPCTFPTKDVNGNSLFWSYAGINQAGGSPYPWTLTDTLGRKTLISGTVAGVAGGRQLTLNMSNSQGATSPFILLSPALGVLYPFSETYECPSQDCQIPGNVLQSVTLPDGSQYSFTYDCNPSFAGSPVACSNTNARPTGTSLTYGTMTGLTLPTGGTMNFSYTNFTDALGSMNHWISGVSYGGGSWTYSQATGCGTACQTVTVARPNGAHEVYTFNVALPGAPLNTQIQYYAGSVGGSPSLTIAKSYAQYPACSNGGLAVPMPPLTAITVTVPGPAGNLIAQSSPVFDSLSEACTLTTGKLLSNTEFGFGLNSVGPQLRKTVLTYLDDVNPNYRTSGTINGVSSLYSASSGGIIYLPNNPNAINIADRMTDQQIQDAGGSVLAEAKTSYDSSALVSVPQVQNHDDTNFGTANTLRGNPTLVQALLSGSFINAATINYDMTGQITQAQDANGNVTSFTYTDNFFTDASPATNPPAPFTPANPTNAFPKTIALPIIGASTIGYYYGTGKLAFSVDQNGADSYIHYLDPLDRTTSSFLPPANGSRGWSLTTYVPGGTQTDSYSAINDTTPSTACVSCTHSRQNADAFGRLVTSTLVSDPDGPTTTAVTYDSSGRTQTVSNPYRSTSDSTYGLTTPTFDNLGRPTLLTEPDSSSVKLYYGVNVSAAGGASTQLCSPSSYGYGYPVLQVDEAGNKSQSWADAFGRTIEDDEPNSTGSLTVQTCYAYDSLDNLRGVYQTGGTSDQTQWRVRTYTYDSLSRLVSATEPESGTAVYTYDNNGNLLTKTSPAPNQTSSATVTVSYCYDALNRLTAKGYTFSPNTPTACSGGTLPSPVASYFYDQSSFGISITNGVGRRTGMTDADSSEAWSYDSVGQVLADHRGSYSTAYTYSLDGSISTLSYPSLAGGVGTVTYTTGGAGRPLSVTNYATNAHYAPSGDLVSAQYGSNSNIVSTRILNNRLQPCWLYVTTGTPLPWNSTPCTATATPGNILDLKYNFGSGGDNGNVLGIINNRDNTRSQSFTYDSLNRLYTAQTQTAGVTVPNSNCWGLTFGYDPWGNLLQSSATGPSGCGEPIPALFSANAANQLVGACYDAAGNLLDPGGCTSPHTYTYDAENHLSSAAGTNYVYDGDGKRVTKLVPGTKCVRNQGTNPPKGSCQLGYHPVSVEVVQKAYLYDTAGEPIVEIKPGSTGPPIQVTTSESYVYFGGLRLAKTGWGGFGYYFGDHLSTARVVTDSSGNILDDSDFYPFGGERPAILPTSGNTYKFTGYERDAESGLDYASARHYNSTLGRFISPDLLSGSPGYPQSWNRYSYVMNNPLNLVDPTGMDADDPDCDSDDPCAGRGNNNGNPSSGYANTDWSAVDLNSQALSYSAGGSDKLYQTVTSYDITEAQFWIGGLIDFYNGWITALNWAMGHDTHWEKLKPSNRYQAAGMKATPYILGAAVPGGGEGELGVVGIEAIEASGGIRLSEIGLDLVEQHLVRFGDVPENAVMMRRLRDAFSAGKRVTGADANFYLHEAAEATMMNRGVLDKAAHDAVLAKYDKFGVSHYSLYHPEAMNANPSGFGSNWWKFWNLFKR